MDDRHGFMNLPATYVGGKPKPGMDSIGGGFSDSSGRGFSPAGPAAMQPIYDHLWNQTVEKLNTTAEALQNEYTVKLNNLPHSIENELAAVRAAGTTHPLPPVAAIQRELQVRNTLLLRKTAELHAQVALAHAFYGSDPINKSTRDFLGKSKTFGRVTTPDGIASQKWESSYRAAWSARYLNDTIALLNQQHVNVQNFLAAAQTDEQARLVSQQEAQRVAAELARMAAEAETRRVAAEQARVAAEAAAQQVVAEQQRLKEIADAARRAQEQARLAALKIALAEAEANAEAATEHFATEQARLQAEMEQRIEQIQKRLHKQRQSLEIRWNVIDTATAVAKRQAQLATLKIQQRKEKQSQAHNQQQALLEAQTKSEQQERGGPTHAPEVHHVYPASGAVASSSLAFSLASTTLRLPPVTASAIMSALHSGMLVVTAAGTALLGPVLVGFAALLPPSRLGNGERFTMSVPLAELSSASAQTLREIADRQGALDLPIGLGVRPLGLGAEVFVATTDDFHIRSGVQVLNAAYDLLNEVYETALPDSPTDFLTWTPAITPGNSSTEQPIVQTETLAYSGAPIIPIEGRLDLNPILVEGWDTFIIVFPDDSGIAPLYVVFSSPYAGAYVKGKYSGRLFNPEQAGGPILDLDWRTAVITQAGIDAVKLHIARLDQSDANDIMVRRLEKILSHHGKITDTDLRYYTHEIRELERYRAFGYSDTAPPSDESQIWNNAHTATLEDYKLGSELTLLYSEEAISAMNAQDQREYVKDMRSFEQ